MKPNSRFIQGAAVAVILLVCTVPRAPAQGVIEVNTLADSGPGSLRAALASARDGDRIVFTVAGTIVLTNGPLLANTNLTVAGQGPAELAVSGNQSNRVFTINSNVTVFISGLTIRNGKALDGAPGGDREPGGAGSPGGGIYSAGTLTLSNCIMVGNSAGNGGLGGHTCAGGPGGAGGGIFNLGTLTLASCLVSNNLAGWGGKGAVALAGETGQPGGAGGSGGGIYSVSSLTLDGSVICSNTCGPGGDGSAGYSYEYPASGSGTRGGHGAPGGSGGGICSTGTLVLADCRIESNLAGNGGGGGHGGNGGYVGSGGDGNQGGLGGSGGGIWAASILTLTNTTVTTCLAGRGGHGGDGGHPGFQPPWEDGWGGFGGDGGAGGGIWAGDSVVLNNCTLSRNCGGSAGLGGDRGGPEYGPAYPGFGGGGGGLAVGASALLTNCTISGNTGGNGMGEGHGGGIRNGLALTLCSCTVVSNATGGPLPESPFLNYNRDGGGIWNGGAGVALALNTIVALNSDYYGDSDLNVCPDLCGGVSSLGHNLIGIADGGGGFVGTDRTGRLATPLDPCVGPLADNGGPTGTHALLAGSPAIDAGDNTNAPATDQRGLPRVVCAVTDIGAFELQSCQPRIRGFCVAADRRCQLEFNGAPDTTYTLQASTNLVDWTNVAALPAGSTGLFGYCDTSGTNQPQRFFRLRCP